MAFNFPSSPVLDQTYTSGSATYRYNGNAWIVVGAAAAPLDAMAYSGMQVNGGMEVSQERGSTVLTLAANAYGYVLDGWSSGTSGTIAGTAAQVADAPPGYANSLKLTVTTAKATLASGDVFNIWTAIEGYRVSRLGWGAASAQSITISFWCKTHRTGTYGGAVQNGASTRSYAFTWTQSVADTWEYKTITIPGDVTGAWDKNNAAGMYFTVNMASFATIAPGVWTASAVGHASGCVNGVAATTDTFQLTGLTVIPGTQAPTAAQSPNIMRPYDQELVTCKRYYYRRVANIIVYSSSGSAMGQWYSHPTIMRSAPTMDSAGGTFSNASSLTQDNITIDGFRAHIVVTATAPAFLDNYTQIADARL